MGCLREFVSGSGANFGFEEAFFLHDAINALFIDDKTFQFKQVGDLDIAVVGGEILREDGGDFLDDIAFWG